MRPLAVCFNLPGLHLLVRKWEDGFQFIFPVWKFVFCATPKGYLFSIWQVVLSVKYVPGLVPRPGGEKRIKAELPLWCPGLSQWAVPSVFNTLNVSPLSMRVCFLSLHVYNLTFKNTHRNLSLGAEEKTVLEKCLLSELEDLSLVPRTFVFTTVCSGINAISFRGQTSEAYWPVSPANQWPLGLVSHPVSKGKVHRDRETRFSLHTHEHTYTHSHMHTCALTYIPHTHQKIKHFKFWYKDEILTK